MTATELIEQLLANEPLAGRRPSEAPTHSQSTFNGAAHQIVQILLAGEPLAGTPVFEASVHRPKRSQVWVASFTGPRGQVWKSTGLTDRDQALLVAKDWESKARAERAKLGGAVRKPIWRVSLPASSTMVRPLTQKEVAALLHMSERGVRAVERRAFQKLRDHPLLRDVWQRHLAGELDENQLTLSQDEIEALLNLARTPEERCLLQKVLRLIQS